MPFARSATRSASAFAALACIAALALGCPADEHAAAGAGGMQASEPTSGAGALDDADASAPDLDGPFASFEDRPCPTDSTLTYESFGAPLFLNYCEGCHGSARGAGQRQGAPPNVTFDDVGAIRSRARTIWMLAGDQNMAMPPVGGPSMELRRQLGEWLACGAPTRAD